MDTHAKRAFSVLVTVAVVAVTVFGIVGVTAPKVSAATCNWITAPTTGNVGDVLTFKVRIYDPTTDYVGAFLLTTPDGRQQFLATQKSIGPTIQGRGITYIDATTSTYRISLAGRYTLSGPLSECGSITITITESAPTTPTNLDLSGSATGHISETLTYTASVTQSGRVLSGYSVPFTFYAEANLAALKHQTVTTDANGKASASYAFTEPGTYRVHAGGLTAEDEMQITITAADDESNGGGGATAGGSGQTGGDATTAKTANTSVAGLEDIASQAEAVTGLGSNALLIVLAIAGIILLALIAGMLLMRRKGEEDYDLQYEEEEPYRRE